MKKMKKLLAGLMAATMVMSMSVTAFAAVYDSKGNEITYPDNVTSASQLTDAATVTVTKTYNATNPGTISPAETFSFTGLTCTSVTDAADGVDETNAPVPNIASVSYNAGDAGNPSTMTKDIEITLPSYNSVGIYTYTFTENSGNTAGVTYYSKEITLVVTVIQDESGRIKVAAIHTEDEGDKSDDFENEYSAGSLTVSKTVTGLLGDRDKDFTIKVTFTAPESKEVKEAISYTNGGEKTIAAGWSGTKEVEVVLSHGEDVTFTNIPYGVTYTVVENDYTAEADGGYDEASYNFDDNNKKIDTASENVAITNNKGGNVDTGISLDNMPYIMVLALVALGLVGFVSKKRSMEF